MGTDLTAINRIRILNKFRHINNVSVNNIFTVFFGYFKRLLFKNKKLYFDISSNFKFKKYKSDDYFDKITNTISRNPGIAHMYFRLDFKVLDFNLFLFKLSEAFLENKLSMRVWYLTYFTNRRLMMPKVNFYENLLSYLFNYSCGILKEHYKISSLLLLK